ncbi:hypothetical protein CEXT_533011 [Caerostris extrusa]|uniref:Uncharacterized protein n=1 Tax=Caerostris extrusa TaxID=172846 RepID=A0AAV4PKY1_CAEEX|nr:hypothetical protein CEXT_533011 [Caerostris extrusa]
MIQVQKFNLTRKKLNTGPGRDLNPGPLAPKARIIPLDHRATRVLLAFMFVYGIVLTEISDPEYIGNPLSLLLFCRKKNITDKETDTKGIRRRKKIGEQRSLLRENSERGIVMDARTIGSNFEGRKIERGVKI